MNIELQAKSLEKSAQIIIPEGGIRKKLKQVEKEGRPLIVKLGFDPTAPDLHLGHAVVLKKLKEFQDFGHKIIVIIGDFTAQIGDPTGKNKSRPPLSSEQVAVNSQTYLNQLSKVLDLSKVEVRFNSKWFNEMRLAEMIKLMSQHTLAQILERKDFQNRYNNGVPISLHELVYPILQGHDSVMIDADIEIGGADQLLNCLVGGYMQEVKGKVAQTVICMPLLAGTDGKDKMSKSQGNYIGLNEDVNDVFGKVMSIPDSLLKNYVELTTDFSDEEKSALVSRLESGENPMTIKKLVASNIVKQYHGAEQAEAAENFFYNQVQNRSLDAKQYAEVAFDSLGFDSPKVGLVDLCHALTPDNSKSAIRKLIEAGAVSIGEEKVVDIVAQVDVIDGLKLKIGKRGFFEIRK